MNNKKPIYRQGIIVAVVLAVLTGVEYIVATHMTGAALLLVLMAVVKGALVAWYFMHIYSLWTEEEAH
ncbi:MAG: cytochrome C oxidase subunit IV family protein [Caldilineaceae bacterium]|nr:cytochrome C oxidase subunit IV family protein [Caldilineaceae bacterium]MBP8106658.1 cytochrome C oxidase subunit IV family protein [Caldilineaceae bacterium]MBP8122202.1 cytochrome C oxidase subunit IV family protein [Caldilineaceae bacterium]MBP9071709.1 cytochrome C oxidase subunit IV family protein [Caldilineaceae bacterium]